MALTDTRLRTLKPKGRAELLEADGNGLYIRVRVARGGLSRTWQFRRRDGKRLSITTLGSYPEISIKEARLKAAELATKRALYSPTVEEVAQQWLGERVDHTQRRLTRSAVMSIGRSSPSSAPCGCGTSNLRTSPA